MEISGILKLNNTIAVITSVSVLITTMIEMFLCLSGSSRLVALLRLAMMSYEKNLV